MKRTMIAVALASMALFSCCTKQGEKMDGSVRIALAPVTDIVDVTTKSNVSDFTSLPQASDFKVQITDSHDNVTLVTNLDDVTTLPVGDYIVSAEYGSLSDEGFDKPCFKGSQNFTVKGGQTSDVKVTVKLAGSVVKLAFTDNFLHYYSDYTFTITTGNSTVISVPKGETRAVFMDAYQFKVKGELTNQAGKQQELAEMEFKNLEPATCYTLKFDASNVGGSTITISFDDTVVDAGLTDVDLND
ncbi:MAG TPA: hypothetical protein DDX33_01815 [Rikenellaceae bacterium]|nr:hypothetical protein [Rikenellaceae bacterium]